MPLLEVRGLVKSYGRRRVVDGVDFEVGPSEIVGLLGPNGAGKTTCFRMTCGMIEPNRGKVELLNEWVAVLGGGIKLSTLAGAVHPYPTLGEINKKVAGDLIGQKLFSDKVKKGLKFFFHLKGRACEPG